MYTKKEKHNIRCFCRQFGSIQFPPHPTVVEETAVQELKQFLADFPLEGTATLVLGRPEAVPALGEACAAGILAIGEVSPEDDGFEIKWAGSTLFVAGANPRGVLYGVYELEDRVLSGEAPDTLVVPAFRKRSDALGHYQNARTFNFGNDTIDDKKAQYLARLRINQFCACFDGSAFGNHLSEFVHSDVFPFMRQPSREAVTQLKNTAAIFGKYGIDFIMMLWEPTVPALFAPIDAYPADALGTVHRPWGGDENKMERTLCINSPLVQEYLRDVMGKFIREYPDVKGLFLYNMDGGSWLCTPELCPRCRAALVDSDPTLFNPWENQAKLVTLLSEAAHAVNPDFTINFWGDIHFHGAAVEKMLQTAQGYDHLTTACMGSDHDIFVTNIQQPCFEVEVTLKTAAQRGLSSYMYYAYNKSETVQPGLPTPFATAEAIQTFRRWGFDNLMEVTGPTPALNQVTALTMRQFQSQPDTDPESWLQALAEKQFGSEAGPHMYAVWQEIHEGFECWRDYNANPLTGSNFIVRMGLTSTFDGTPSILPGILERFEEFYYDTVGKVEPWRLEEFRKNQTPEFLERFCAMEAHFATAEEQARLACEKADSEPVGICYYDGAFEGISRHTRFEFARLNLCSIRMTHSMCRQVIHMLRAVALLGTMREDPISVDTLQPKYLQLLREDCVLLTDYIAMLEEFSQLRPCLAMSGMCENEICIYIDDAQKRLDGLLLYLKENKQ